MSGFLRGVLLILPVACTTVPDDPSVSVEPYVETGSTTVVHEFTMGSGLHVRNSLALGPDGRLYGTFWKGSGTEGDGTSGACGGVFALNPGTGAYQVLHVFAPTLDVNGLNADGCGEVGGVGFGPDGRAYGTSSRGGSNNCTSGTGCGTLWSVDTAGSDFVKLFDGIGGSAGMHYPSSMMERVGSDGMYFAATGAANKTVIDRWNISAKTITNIATLDPAVIGTGYSTPAIDGSGWLRGYTTNKSGDASGSASGGFYVLNPATGGATSIAFPTHAVNTADDNTSFAGPTYMADGTTWAVLPTGGSDNWGWIARLNAGGSNVADLYDFQDSGNYGFEPIAQPVAGPDGLIYGTTVYGGSNVDVVGRHVGGMAWSIASDGTGFTDLFDFPIGNTDPGNNPEAGFTVGSDHHLYGATFEGGSNGVGTVFKLTVCIAFVCY